MSRVMRESTMQARSKQKMEDIQHIKTQESHYSHEETILLKHDDMTKKGFTPRTPMATHSAVSNIRQRLEVQLSGQKKYYVEDKTSPGLANLRNTPGMKVRDRQENLVKKHLEARGRVDSLSVGGGVSLWPEMDDMRLTKQETLSLVGLSVGLFTITIVLFNYLHGHTEKKLIHFTNLLVGFPRYHQLVMSEGNHSFSASVLDWHTHFQQLLSDVHQAFDIHLAYSPVSYQLCTVFYIMAVCALLYYLVDNMFAKSKLTPRRIKNWISLLVVTGTWTFMLAVLLARAQRLEEQVERNVHWLSSQLADLVYQKMDLQVYHNVLLNWRTQCLPPTTFGTLTVMGVVPVRDVAYYLQYYSFPVITALLMPVVKLIMSLKQLYLPQQ